MGIFPIGKPQNRKMEVGWKSTCARDFTIEQKHTVAQTSKKISVTQSWADCAWCTFSNLQENCQLAQIYKILCRNSIKVNHVCFWVHSMASKSLPATYIFNISSEIASMPGHWIGIAKVTHVRKRTTYSANHAFINISHTISINNSMPPWKTPASIDRISFQNVLFINIAGLNFTSIHFQLISKSQKVRTSHHNNNIRAMIVI